MKCTKSKLKALGAPNKIREKFVKLDEQIKYYPIEYEQHSNDWFRWPSAFCDDEEDEKNQDHRIAGDIYCKSCFIKNKIKIE